MIGKRLIKLLTCVMLPVSILLAGILPPVLAKAEVRDYGNGIKFDHEYYASLYPEVTAIIGDDENLLFNHYLLIGVLEGRTAYDGQSAEEIENLRVASKAAREAEPTPEVPAETPAPSETPVPAEVPAADDSTAPVDTTETGEVAVPVEEPVPTEVPVTAEVPVPEIPATQTSNGLVLVYLNGTDLETDDGSGTRTINNMLTASTAGNTRFVILAGGTKKWSHPMLQSANDGKVVSYVIENGTIRELKQYDAGANGKDYLTADMISEFVKDTASTYSSEHTSMYFWNHGGGAAGGYGVNEVADGKGMSNSEVAEGIRSSGVKFESVGFDTCLNGSLEVASCFADVAKYYVGSQENESGYGWDFKSFATYGTGDFTDFGKKLIDDYDKWNSEKKVEKTATLSMLDLSKVPKTQQLWNDFLTTYGSNSIGIQQILAARAKAREFSYGEAADARNEEVDLSDFLSHFGSPQAQALKDALSEVVLYKNANNMEGVNGLSVFVPGENVYTYKLNRDNVTSQNMSDSAMSTFDKVASVFAGKKDSILFGETWSDQKHFGEQGLYDNEPWFDKEYAAIGSRDTYSYKEVRNGGFAVESELGLTADQLQESEIRVMLKNGTDYISLGRVNNFSRSKDTKSPVFNFNGQWLHINGCPVMLHQIDEFKSDNGHYYKDYYTMVKVNDDVKKMRIMWDATDKTWNQYGYADRNTQLTGRSETSEFKEGDKIQFVYDISDDGKSVRQDTVFDPFTYDSSNFTLKTQRIDNETGVDIMFHGTVTDAYGKTYTTPYFKMEEGTKRVTPAKVNGEANVIKKSKTPSKERWEISDPGSFLTCHYDEESNSYVSYNENTNAFNLILADSGEIVHFDENRQLGVHYDPETDRFHILDADGEVSDAAFTAEELAQFAAGAGSDYDTIFALLQRIIAISEKGEYTEEDNRLLAEMYRSFDNLLDSIVVGYDDDDAYESYYYMTESGQPYDYSETPYYPGSSDYADYYDSDDDGYDYDSSDDYSDDYYDDDDYDYYDDDDYDYDADDEYDDDEIDDGSGAVG